MHAATQLDLYPADGDRLGGEESLTRPGGAGRRSKSHDRAGRGPAGGVHRAAPRRVLAARPRGCRHHRSGVPRHRHRAGRDGDGHLDRVAGSPATRAAAGDGGHPIPTGHRDHRRIPAERGCDDPRHDPCLSSRQDYPDLQVILAYNTPRDLPVEDELRALAAADPRLVALRVRDSASKAQNVNAALAHVRGEFVGVFDADHHPAQVPSRRAWRWISHRADVVQGHCVVRDGSRGFLQRLVTTEFEAIYAVAHPGRARVQGFGIFGGSNGYWRTPSPARDPMRAFSSPRTSTRRCASSPAAAASSPTPGWCRLELAPPDWRGLWNQRLRWAQGWSQVSMRHLLAMLRNDRLSRRQRIGLAYLLLARDLPMDQPPGIPDPRLLVPAGCPAGRLVRAGLRAHDALHHERRRHADMERMAARPAAPAPPGPLVRRLRLRLAGVLHRVQNVITRTAHLKELMREKQWKVTPRPMPAERASRPRRSSWRSIATRLSPPAERRPTLGTIGPDR